MLAVRFYDVATAVHVMAVVVAFGWTFVTPAVGPWLRTTHPEALPAWHDAQVRLSRMLVTPAMVVVLLVGIYLASDADVWDQAWVSIPLLILLVLFGMLHGLVVPRERRLASLSLDGPGRDYDVLMRQTTLLESLQGVLVLAAILLMVAKPT
jgi:uncharacterized membrane protein